MPVSAWLHRVALRNMAEWIESSVIIGILGLDHPVVPVRKDGTPQIEHVLCYSSQTLEHDG